MSRDELIVLVRWPDAQITAQAGQIAVLMKVNDPLALPLPTSGHQCKHIAPTSQLRWELRWP